MPHISRRLKSSSRTSFSSAGSQDQKRLRSSCQWHQNIHQLLYLPARPMPECYRHQSAKAWSSSVERETSLLDCVPIQLNVRVSSIYFNWLAFSWMRNLSRSAVPSTEELHRQGLQFSEILSGSSPSMNRSLNRSQANSKIQLEAVTRVQRSGICQSLIFGNQCYIISPFTTRDDGLNEHRFKRFW